MIFDFKMIEENGEVYYKDDPIRLFDCEQARVFCCPVRKDDVEDSSSIGNAKFNKHSSDYEETLRSYKRNSSILPLTFFDIDSNLELLNQCRPLTVQLVDCERFPGYHKWKTNVTDSNFNLTKINQEEDCIEISSSDENDTNSMIKRTTSKNTQNTSKFDFVSINYMAQQIRKKMKKTNNDKINMHLANKHTEVIDLEDLQENFMIDALTEKKVKTIMEQEKTDVDNIYERIINKTNKYNAYQYNVNSIYEFENKKKSILHRRDKNYCTHGSIDCKQIIDSNINIAADFHTGDTEIKESTIEGNNGSSSLLQPCQSKIKGNDELKRIQNISNTSFPLNIKNKIKKYICMHQLYSSNRVIPHYHSESMYASEKSEPFNLNQNISQNSSRNSTCLQKNITYVPWEIDPGLSNQLDQNQFFKKVDVYVDESNNINHNNHSITKPSRRASRNCLNKCSLLKLNKKQIEFNLSRQIPTNLRVNKTHKPALSQDARRGNKSNSMSLLKVPILLDRQPQDVQVQVHHKNMPSFPLPRVVSNRCNSYANDLTSQTVDVSPVNYHPFLQHNICPNNSNTEFSSNMRKGKPVSPSVFSISLPSTVINQVPEYQNDNSETSKTIENTNAFVQSELVYKYPQLIQCLKRPPLAINKPTTSNVDEQICLNNKAINFDKTLYKGYSPPILPIPTYQKTLEILAKTKLYDLDKGFSQT